MDFTVSAEHLNYKIDIKTTSENETFYNLNHTLKIFDPKFLRHIDKVKPESLLYKL